ncbi:probable oxidoreductase, LLM family [Lentzea xinjiangensis]|uniref:Probable oxidoreductase, LLM family n=1 Tax=Lentzea xinjiangensis TaxID=402600 RepID=A0A1H9SV36_9PSEU|nr:LLM class flavin-dependent oxidoreductase [Lentzea xinjiangensis]SER88796.1 probable oxidoreductase, LLM family [Lentzea xinjiangensis]
MELGVATFGDADVDPVTGGRVAQAQAIRNIVEAIELAEQVGLDWFGIGEHHTPEFPASSAAPVLAAAAMRTRRIKLSSAVTVLGTDDPVRVYEQFATVDALSHGRAEIIAGRGSSVESFPLFGYDLTDYDRLFSEKLELLKAVNESEHVVWSGTTRAPLNGEYIPPRAERGPLPLWVGVGGSPGSAVRAAKLGLPLATGVLGGSATRNAALVDLYRRAAQELGNSPQQTLVTIGQPGFLADGGKRAREEWWPHYDRFMRTVGAQRGWLPPSRESYDTGVKPGGALMVGGPEEVAERILALHARYGHVRHYLHMDWGALPQAAHLRAIELFGTKVAPIVKAELGDTSVDELAGRVTARR